MTLLLQLRYLLVVPLLLHKLLHVAQIKVKVKISQDMVYTITYNTISHTKLLLLRYYIQTLLHTILLLLVALTITSPSVSSLPTVTSSNIGTLATAGK